jgi:hypothetical protein
MLDRFAQNLYQHVQEPAGGNLFEYRELKCECKSASLKAIIDREAKAMGRRSGAATNLASIGQKNLSLGEVFIQYYYLSQRKQHQ